MAADDRKRHNCVKVCFTDREFIDLGRMAAHENRSPAEMAWVMAKRIMYGSLPAPGPEGEGTSGD